MEFYREVFNFNNHNNRFVEITFQQGERIQPSKTIFCHVIMVQAMFLFISHIFIHIQFFFEFGVRALVFTMGSDLFTIYLVHTCFLCFCCPQNSTNKFPKLI